MWRRYDKQVVERDLKLLSSHGANAIRVFPLWLRTITNTIRLAECLENTLIMKEKYCYLVLNSTNL